MKDSFEIKIPGTDFTIMSNTIYTVIPKPDPNAPDGFKEHGTTKVLNPDVGVTMGAPYNSDMNVWDTGFYEFSPCFRGMNDKEIKAHIDNVQEHIIKPVERIKGVGVLHHLNNKFFDDLVIPLANKTSFNTGAPLELLGLYFSILSRELCPKENEGNPNFKQASYMVVSRSKEISNLAQTDIDNGKAMGEFYSLLKTNKPKLEKLFRYLGIASTAIEDEDTFFTVFNRFLKDKQDGYRNSKIFLRELAKFETEEGEEELQLFYLLHDLYDKKVVKLIKSEYYLNGISLGNSIKHAAMKAVRDPDIKKKIVELSVEEVEEED